MSQWLLPAGHQPLQRASVVTAMHGGLPSPQPGVSPRQAKHPTVSLKGYSKSTLQGMEQKMLNSAKRLNHYSSGLRGANIEADTDSSHKLLHHSSRLTAAEGM